MSGETVGPERGGPDGRSQPLPASPVQRGTIAVGADRLEFVRFAGSEPPILLLHEALGSVSQWRDVSGDLAQTTGHAVIAWSRPGHGASERPPAPRGTDYLDREAALVPMVMDALDVERAHLFGHSDGATIALLVAARFPARVDRLVLEAPHVNVEARTIDAVAAARRTYETTDLPQKLRRHHRHADAVFWAWHDIWMAPAFRPWSIEHELTAVRAPALVIQGCDDPYFSMGQVDIVCGAVAGARRLAIEACGHAPHRDAPVLVLEATRRFLSDGA